MDIDKPLKEYLNPDNIESRLSGVEDAAAAAPSASVGALSELTNFTGTLLVGNLISPAVGVETQEPTSTDFTGSFVSGEGVTFNSTQYHMGGVSAGTLQWGAKQDDGSLTAGGGTVELDSNGISIITGPSAGDGDKLKFKDYNTGDVTHQSLSLLFATTDTMSFLAESGTTDYASSQYSMNAYSASGGAGLRLYSATDAVITAIGLNGTSGIFKVDHTANTVSVNNGDAIDLMKSDTFTPTITGSTVSGAGTYTTQLGAYYVIGKLVFFEVTLVWTAHTGTGNMRISGLPYTSANNGISVPCTPAWSNITLAAAGNKLLASISPNTSIVSLFEIGSGAIANLPMDTAGTLSVAGCYIRA